MRHPHYELESEQALELLGRADYVHLATTTPAGAPLIRALHSVLLDGVVWFHGSPEGEKSEIEGRAAVVSAEQVVASIPSYFIDPLRACPATTYYRAVQAHGSVTRLCDRAQKSRVLAALMEKYQPEGGYSPLEAGAPHYRNMIEHLMVFGVRIERLEGKRKLGQNRSPAQLASVIGGLWKRGLPGDARAIEALLAANPAVPVPDFLRGPAGARLVCALEEEHVAAAVELVANEYWNVDVPREVLARAHRDASAWVGACDAQGRLIATARAVSDGAKFAWIADVAVARDWRGHGLGRSLLRLLLDHPALRHVRGVRLGTADAMEFYRALGFVELERVPLPFKSVPMLLVREP